MASIPMNLTPLGGSLIDPVWHRRDSTSVTSKGSEPRNVEKLPAKTCGKTQGQNPGGRSWFPEQKCGEDPFSPHQWQNESGLECRVLGMKFVFCYTGWMDPLNRA